ncbi:ATP-binding cassette domain-containing protein [Sphingopyxis sp. FBM22]|nr:ATP-binding cassette domain-containing protein [Sphingopyxis yananensis]
MRQPDLEQLLAEVAAPEQRDFAVAGLLAGTVAMTAVLLLGVSGWFITGAALAGLGGVLMVQTFNYLLPSAGIRLLAIMRTASRYGERLYGHGAALRTLARLRARLFDHILTIKDVRAVSAGDAVTRLVQDIGALEDDLVRRPARAAAMMGGAVGVGLAWLVAPAASLTLLLLLGVVILWARWATPRFLAAPAADLADGQARLKAMMLDHAAAAPEILAYGLAGVMTRNLETQAAMTDSARRRLARGEAVVDAGLLLGGGAAMALMLTLSTATLPLTVLAVLAAAGAVEALGGYVRAIARGAVVAEARARLAAMTHQHAADSGEDKPQFMGTEDGKAGPCIGWDTGGDRITLMVGERAAIFGASGSGKTHFLERLAGVRPVTAGDGFYLDGQNVANFPLAAVRAVFAWSPQDAQMLSGTICDNLRLARPGLRDDQLWEALRIACLDDDVRAMPHGLHQWVGDGGSRLSGGQRKRLSIARSVLAGRPWLLLDEPSEGLDSETERRLVAQLDNWLTHSGTGLVVVSHRPALLGLGGRHFTVNDSGQMIVGEASDPY